MKVDQRNKLRKIVSLSLDTSSTNDAIENYKRSSTQAQSIEIYDFRNSRSEILPMMTWMIRVSLLISYIKLIFISH